jgi:hypothetical protein
MSQTARTVIPFPQSNPRAQVAGSDEALARIRRFLEDRRMSTSYKPGAFEDFEKGLHAKIMEYEREVLAEDMARADVDAEAIVVDGVTHRRVVRCEDVYFTAAGPVRLMRAHADEEWRRQGEARADGEGRALDLRVIARSAVAHSPSATRKET